MQSFQRSSLAAVGRNSFMAVLYASAVSASTHVSGAQHALRPPVDVGSFPCGPISTEVWSIQPNQLGYTSPVIGPNGNIHTATKGGGALTAFNSSGNQAWSYTTTGPILSAPAVDGAGVIYVTSGRSLVAVTGSDGSELWSQSTGDQLVASPAIGTNGYIYATSQGGVLYAFKADTGALAWNYSTDGLILTSPAVGPDGTVYVSSGYHVTALNGVSGNKLWVYTGGLVKAPAVGVNGMVYVASNDGALVAMNGTTGALLWMRYAQGQPLPTPVSIGADGRVYLETTTGIYAFNATTGVNLWVYSTPGRVLGLSVVTTDGSLLIATGDTLYVIEASTGNQTWNYSSTNLTAYTFSAPTVGHDGTIYVGAMDNILVLKSICPGPTPAPGPASGEPDEGSLSSAAAATIGVLVPLVILGVVAGVWVFRRRRLGPESRAPGSDSSSLWGLSTYSSYRERLLQHQVDSAVDPLL